MIKWGRAALLVPIMLFFGWYVPVAWNNVFVCDDFWHRLNVLRQGFVGAQFHYWLQWEGSFIHTLFATLPHLVHSRYTPFIFNMFAITLTSTAFSAFVRSYARCGKFDSVLIGTYLTVLLYTFTSGASEIRFWLCASVPYMLGIVGLTFLATLRRSKELCNRRTLLPLLISLILVVGNKVSFIAAAVALIVVCDLCERKFTKHTYLLLCAIAALSLINVAAPGNFSRLNENVANAETAYGVADVFMARIRTVALFSTSLVFIAPLVLFKGEGLQRLRRDDIVKIAGVLVAVLVVDSLIMYICFRDPGPARTYIILEWLALTAAFVLIASLRRVVERFRVCRMFAIAFALCAVIGLSWIEFEMLRDVPATLTYSRYSRFRDSQAQEAKNGSSVEVIRLPPSYHLLSYFSNDKVWLENVYLPSFGKGLSCKGIVEGPSGL